MQNSIKIIKQQKKVKISELKDEILKTENLTPKNFWISFLVVHNRVWDKRNSKGFSKTLNQARQRIEGVAIRNATFASQELRKSSCFRQEILAPDPQNRVAQDALDFSG